jgi:hypothetical protein
MRDVVFTEVNPEKDATAELEKLEIEADAVAEARRLSTEQKEEVYRVIFQKDPTKEVMGIIKRDILVYARKNPKAFLNIVNDPTLRFQSMVNTFFDQKLLSVRNNGKEVWLNCGPSKRKILTLQFGQEPYAEAALFLKTDEGIEVLKFLETQYE